MSYEIVYAKQFIKTNKYIIPTVLMGSNNCTMYYGGREIKERDWTPLSNNLVCKNEEELMKEIEKWLGSKYQEHFKYNSKWVDDKALIRFMKNGIKNALTIEEIKEQTGYSAICYLSIWQEHENKQELFEIISNNKDFDTWLEKAKQRIENKNDKEQIYYYIGWHTIEPLGATKQTEITGQVVAKIGDYYVKIVDNKLYFAEKKKYATVFESIEQAKQKLEEFKTNYKIKFIKHNTPKQKEKNFVIQYNGNLGVVYMAKHTKGTLYPSTNINNIKQKFETEKQAERFIKEKLIGFRITDVKVINLKEIAV